VKKSLFVIALCAPAALLVGCKSGSGSGYVPAKIEAPKGGAVATATAEQLMPLKVGNTWTYEVQSQTTQVGRVETPPKTEVTFTVTASKTNPDGSIVAEMQIRNAMDEVSEVQKWHVDKTGVYMDSSGKPETPQDFTPPQPFIQVPFKKDTPIKWQGRGPVPTGDGKSAFDFQGTLTYKGEEVADTVNDHYNTGVFQQEQEWTLSPEMLKALAPGAKTPTPANQTPADPNKPNSGTQPDGTTPIKGSTETPDTKPIDEVKPEDVTPIDPTKGLSVSTIYFAPGTGIVRFRQEMRISDKILIVQVFKLKSKSIK